MLWLDTALEFSGAAPSPYPVPKGKRLRDNPKAPSSRRTPKNQIVPVASTALDRSPPRPDNRTTVRVDSTSTGNSQEL